MRHMQGFTLSELVTTLAVTAILAALVAPSFTELIRNNRLETITNQLIASTQTARSYAVKGNARVTMSTTEGWDNGWQIHYDPNHNGQLDDDEEVLVEFAPLHEGVEVTGNRPVADYISYLGSGESHWASGQAEGAFQAGTLEVCPAEEGEGYQLVLSRGGRLRKEDYDCPDSA